ncbi:MAG: phosphoribosylformylglycinamidine synthase [Erysipelotrichaceae bacterium]|nr:phosphoribosylformylglycinamidine synthase [Erysipelotrichaceae bacterium]
MVYRIYSEKKPGFAPEAESLLSELHSFLGIKSVKNVRILNRYDVEDIEKDLFDRAVTTVFSEPPVDNVYENIDLSEADKWLAVEALPGQFDQRADSAAQCIQLLSQKERPIVRHAKIYGFAGEITDEEMSAISHYLINPVETREASLDLPETLHQEYAIPSKVETVTGFINMDKDELNNLLDKLGLAMDIDDLLFLQKYFKEDEQRDPTITEIRVVDTYWSDHCRHTTFSTHLDEIEIEDEKDKAAYERYLNYRVEVYGEEKASKRPKTLMDLATIGAKTLKKRGLTPEIDSSEEINACSINVVADVDGKDEDWLLMFKNETHNHPTEIEPFGGAATCIGGCIRDPLSGRVYVHQAMRFTGGGDPTVSLKDTIPGKLPQRKIAQRAAAGYSSYGNQIGLATGHVAEVYHEGYVAKRLECGALVGAAPKANVVREVPSPGDVIVLLGGRTGRDGIGGATGSSKSHNMKSLQTMASEVQKGNAPEERKIQRLFRDGNVTRLIKRCNDFGAGGVSVAIGELADGLEINLDAVRKKYDGLDGTELAISESQERMAVVLDPKDVDTFIKAAEKENLEAYRVAVVTESPRMVMSWKGEKIADLSREFLNTNGAVKHTNVKIEKCDRSNYGHIEANDLRTMASSLKSASRRGLTERFDSTIGAKSILLPFGGKTQHSPAQVMAALFPVLPGQTTKQASLMSWGFDPDLTSVDPYDGAKASVYSSVAKIVAAGGDYKKVYLSFQEFFEKLKNEPKRWGKPFSALLGALDAQMEIGAAAIGGKDSMSGSFLDLDVPPTLISFAVAPLKADEVLTTEFKAANNPVCLFTCDKIEDAVQMWDSFMALKNEGKVLSAYAVEGGIAEAIMKMSFGNEVGFELTNKDVNLYQSMPAAIIAEMKEEAGVVLGHTSADSYITLGEDRVSIKELFELNEKTLAKVYPLAVEENEKEVPTFSYDKKSNLRAPEAYRTDKPLALIPVFPGTNCEYDTANALIEAGAEAEIFVIRNLTSADVEESAKEFAEAIKKANMIVIPGGFSGGDEPDGSAKFITAFFRAPVVKEAVTDMLDNRGGLMLGICNGFQALVKLGLVPYGKIIDTDDKCPTLTYNTISRHQSKVVHTRVASNMSPWLSEVNTGDVVAVPVSHGEGRFVGDRELLKQLAANGQVATQYVDLEGNPSMDTEYNPNGSFFAIEGITSPDGRVLGKMGHSERIGKDLYKNVPGNYELGLFRSAVNYFKK